MSYYDIVVIGAGNAGLTCAATLARAGKKVLLLEKHNVPGGCATSFVRGRFEFEVALHQLSGIGRPEMPGLTRMALDSLGVTERLQFVFERDLYRVHIPGRIDCTLPADREGFIAVLSQQFPAEAENIIAFMDLVYRVAPQYHVGKELRRDEVGLEQARKIWPEFFDYALRTSKQVLDELFQDEGLKHVLAAYWSYMGSPPAKMKFMDLAILLWVYIEFYPAHIKGGSQALSNAILATFTEAGGEVRFSTRVDKILVESGRACGVVTAGGEKILAGNIVSNISPIVTYTQMMDSSLAPPAVLQDMASRKVGVSGFTLYVGLDCEPEEIGVTSSCTFIGDNLDHDINAELMSTLHKPNYALLTCYDFENREFSPPGASQVALMTCQYAEAWKDIDPEDYAATKYAYAEHLLEMAERTYPGFREHIEEVEVATPLTYMHYLGHPGGAIYGFEQDIYDMNVLHPDLCNSLPGLYLAGAWAEAGGFGPTLERGVEVGNRLLANSLLEVAS